MRTKSYSINQTKFLSDEELTSLEALLARNKGTRDGLIIELALATGARASELLAIRQQDLNPIDKTVFIQGLKGSRDREIPLNKELFERTLLYSRAQKTEKIFNISYSRFDQIWDKYKPAKKKLHSTRHTFAIELFKRTRDIKLVQIALGHASITNTMVYVNYVFSKEEMRKILK